MQYLVGMSTNYDVYADGFVRIIKDTCYFFVVVTWGTLCFIYGRKIARTLNVAGKEVTPEEKKIKRFCYTVTVCMVLCFFWKFLPLLSFAGRDKNYYGIPPCKLSSFNLISAFFLLMQVRRSGSSKAQRKPEQNSVTLSLSTTQANPLPN